MKSLSPLILFLLLYLGVSIVLGDFYKVPVTVAFMLCSVYAVSISRGAIQERIECYSRGAGSPTVLLMVWIYILAGAFATSAKAMGAVDATVSMTLQVLPSSMLLPGIFLAACFISLAIGTSVGTIVALTPVATGIAQQSDMSLAMMVAIVVGGAYFGDNLSFISDTTIAATQTQGCRMRDKFRTNLRLVLPIAIIVLLAYYMMGRGIVITHDIQQFNGWKVIPYLAVIITAVCGLNVMTVLLLGLLLTAIIGIADGSYDVFGWMGAMGDGINSMGELIIMAILAAGMLEMIRAMGGIDFLIRLLTRGIKSQRGAELSVSCLVCLVNICTANNTVAIITTGPIARQIATRFGICPRRCASLLDTSSCFTQGILPYSAQMLAAAGLVEATAGISINPASIVPWLFYPMGIGVAVLISIACPRLLGHNDSEDDSCLDNDLPEQAK